MISVATESLRQRLRQREAVIRSQHRTASGTVSSMRSSAQITHDYRELARSLELALEVVSRRVSIHGAARVVRWQGPLADLQSAEPHGVVEQMIEGLKRGCWEHAHADQFRALVEARQFVVVIEALAPVLADRQLRQLISGARSIVSGLGASAPVATWFHEEHVGLVRAAVELHVERMTAPEENAALRATMEWVDRFQQR